MEKLKEIRERKDLTQAQIAKILNISPGTYQRYEYGTITPTLETIKKLADYYNVSIDYLVGREEKNYISNSNIVSGNIKGNNNNINISAKKLEDLSNEKIVELLHKLVDKIEK